MSQEPLMQIGNARTKLQADTMQKIHEEGFCPFCPEHIQKYHTPPIVRTGSHWYVTPNMYPYDNTKFHFLFITTAHITDSNDLSSEAWAELQEHIKWLIAEYKMSNGTLLMRSGDMTKTGATVSHLHAQFIVGESKDKPVLARVG